MNEQVKATYVRELPNDKIVKLCIEKVTKRDEADTIFSCECRICDGEHVGSMIAIYFYRNKKDGGPNKIATSLLETLVPGKDASDIPSYSLQGKIFETTPWHPTGSRHQLFGRFKYIGNNDIF